MKKLVMTLCLMVSSVLIFSQSIVITSISGNDTLCNKAYYQIYYQATGSFNNGNVFYAEISDINGSFASAYPISNSSSATSGYLGNNYPFTWLPAGTGYRIRVVSIDPVVYGTDNGYDLTVFYPDVNVSSSPGQLQATTTFPGTQYQWLECSFFTLPGETNSTFTNGTSGPGVEYAVQITQSGCVDTSDCQPFVTATGIDDQNSIEAEFTSSNPTNGPVKINFNGIISEINLTVYNSTGSLIESRSYYNQNEIDYTINSEPGIYLIQMRVNETESYHYRVIKF